MKLSDFIEKLGTFPPDDIVRFHCPVDNIYRTVWHISYSSLNIEVIVADPFKIFNEYLYFTYANTIKELTKIRETYQVIPFVRTNDIPITIIDKRTDKFFSIIQ
jgi:hypothetical protein